MKEERKKKRRGRTARGREMKWKKEITIFGGYYTTKLQRVGFIHAMHLVLLQLSTKVGIDVFEQFNRLIHNVVWSHQHRLPEVLQPHQVNVLSDEASSPCHQPPLIDVHHLKEPTKTSVCVCVTLGERGGRIHMYIYVYARWQRQR